MNSTNWTGLALLIGRIIRQLAVMCASTVSVAVVSKRCPNYPRTARPLARFSSPRPSRILSSSRFHRVSQFVLLALLARCAPVVVDCRPQMVAQMPLELEDGLPVVPVGMDGKNVQMIVDTGAERTTITDSTVQKLKLPHDSRYATQLRGIGGTTTTTNDVTVDRLVLGGVDFPLERAVVGTFKLQTEGGLNADGLLGADILLAYDLDIDVPGGKLSLYRPRRCPQTLPPWPEPAVEVHNIETVGDRVLVPFELDGVHGMAVLDTGAQRNVLGKNIARRLHLGSLTSMATDPTISQHGIGPAEAIAHLHRFNLLRIGPTALESPELPVLESEAGLGDAVIGEDFLRDRRVWISFRNRQVYVSVAPPASH
jgi:predicted aspartyl protease